MKDTYYFKDMDSSRIIKFNLHEYMFYYLSNYEWVRDDEIRNKFIRELKLEEIIDFKDTYPVKKMDIKYKYFKTNNGIILKIDEDNDMCYRLGSDNMWHMDLPIYDEYTHGELFGSYIELEDNYSTGDRVVYEYENRWRTK